MANLPDMPILAALAVGYLVLVCLMLSSPKMLKWIVMLLLFPASTAIAVDDFTKQIANPTWLMPLQTNRSLAYLILGTTLAGGVLLHLGRLDRPKLGVQTLFILAIGVYAAAIRVLHYGVQDGAESVLLALITIPAIALAITGSIRTWSDFHNVLRILPVFTLLYLGALALQYAISPRTLVMGAENRFVGFLGNPQHAAALFGPLVGLVIFSILNEPIKVLRFAWMAGGDPGPAAGGAAGPRGVAGRGGGRDRTADLAVRLDPEHPGRGVVEHVGGGNGIPGDRPTVR
jgi:hypothetical protein